MHTDDLELFVSFFDGYDLYELIDLLVEADIIDKRNLLERYWYEIKEKGEEIAPFC